MTYAQIKTWIAAHPVATRLAVVVLLLAVGASAGRFIHPRMVVVTKTEVQTVDHVVYQDRVVQGETQYKDRTITKYVFAPGSPDAGCPIASETVEHDQTSDKKDTTTTTVATEDKTTDTKSTTITKPADIPRFAAGVGLGLQPLRPAGAVVLLDFSVRPFEALPLTVGAWGTLPTLDLTGTAVGVKIGVQW